MKGYKTLINNCGGSIRVTLWGRQGDSPSTGNLGPVNVTVGNGEQAWHVQYGDDQNPYLNAVEVVWADPDRIAAATLIVVRRGDQGTLDALLNTNDTLIFGFNPDTNSFSLTAATRG